VAFWAFLWSIVLVLAEDVKYQNYSNHQSSIINNQYKMSLIEINKRYSQLAGSDCCLSCGGAINYAEAKPNEVCVDLGSGRGTDAMRLADEVGIRGFVYGIDISEGMIQKAVDTSNRLGITNIKFIHSNLEKIQLDDNIADLVISNCTINHASNKQAVWNEIYRILKNDGRFVISDIYSTSPVPDEYRNDPEAIAECWAGSVTRTEYIEQLGNAGFSSINIIEESAPYDKGKIQVVSWTIAAQKESGKCACKN
jgi:arsenite methyltransferase